MRLLKVLYVPDARCNSISFPRMSAQGVDLQYHDDSAFSVSRSGAGKVVVCGRDTPGRDRVVMWRDDVDDSVRHVIADGDPVSVRRTYQCYRLVPESETRRPLFHQPSDRYRSLRLRRWRLADGETLVL